jgi:anti-sigma regulatory factor (Ser/Thr protein kinase)
MRSPSPDRDDRRHRDPAVVRGMRAPGRRFSSNAIGPTGHPRRTRKLTEIAGLERSAPSRRSGDAPVHELARLAEIVLPTDVRAPGAARMVVAHCLNGLVTQRILRDAELLASEVVTNSIDHGQLGDGDSVLLRVFLATDTLRVEIENSGTAGVVAANRAGRESGQGGYGLDLVELLAARWGVSRNRSTSVWFELTRA